MAVSGGQPFQDESHAPRGVGGGAALFVLRGGCRRGEIDSAKSPRETLKGVSQSRVFFGKSRENLVVFTVARVEN